MKRWLIALICIAIAKGTAYADRARSLRAIAVVSADAGASREIADRIMLKLSADRSMALVEREQLDLIDDEQAIALLGHTTSERIKVGRLLAADMLVLVARENTAGGLMVHVLVCDCETGARIGGSRVPFDTDGINEIVAEIRSALSRFPDGIRTIVTVPDFISRDLGFDHSHLQADLADLLREILLQKQGLAVVEINEARSIAVELERTGGDLRRLVPLLVEGEYRTDPRGQEGPSISIKVTLRKGEQEAVRIESGAIPIDAAGAFIVGTVQPEALNLLSESGGPGDAPGASFTRLIARADQFAEIGDFERAAALREAALLLQPQAVDQRVALVREYARWNHDPVEVWPRAASKGWDGPFWEYVVGQCRASWRRSLQHVERLILNRQVDLKVGGELFEDTIHSICGIRPTNAAQLGEEERLKKDFIRHVAPALFQLPSSDSPSMREQQRELAVYRIFEMAFLRADGNFLHEEDLDLVGDLLCELLPEDTPVPMVLLYRLKDGTRMFGGDPERNVSPEAWARFARRLMNSPRPLAKACGQYAWLCDHHYRLNQVSEALLAEAESLSASLDSAPLETLDISRHLKQVANEELGWARGAWQKTMATSALSRQEAAPPPNPTPSVEGPLVQAEGTILCERVRLDPLEILLVSQGPGSEKLEGHRWRAAGGSYGWLEIIPAWEGLDVVFSTGAILFLGADQTAREILVGEELSIGSVVFDGRHVWASGGYDQGVYVIDRDGHLVAHITAADGLPDSSYCTPLHVIGPGRVLAAGSIGIKGRGWLATLELVGTRPRVNVFHEAVKAWPHGDASAEAALDPTMRFFPEWIMGHRDETGQRWIYVGRSRHGAPLMVDLDALAVRVYAGEFPRREGPASAFLSLHGLLYIAGSSGDFRAFRLDRQTHGFVNAIERTNHYWHSGNATAGRLTVHDGYLYSIGDTLWQRYHLASRREEILIKLPRSLPDYGSGVAWNLAVSRCFGLVAWHGEKIYRVSVDPKRSGRD